jgi:hypothetical protein
MLKTKILTLNAQFHGQSKWNKSWKQIHFGCCELARQKDRAMLRARAMPS